MTTYSLGRYQLYLQPLRLQDGSRTVKLTARQLHVLLLLARARGEVVSREQFLNQIWGDSFVEESNLTQTIFLLRRTLGKSPSGGDLIETIPKAGYRIAPEAFASSKNCDLTAGNPSSFGSAEEARFLQSLNMLVDSVADLALYMLDGAGRVRMWTSGAERVAGYSEKEAFGKHYATFFTPEDVACGLPERLLSKALRNGRVTGEGWRLRKNGERFWAKFDLAAVKNASGRHIGFANAIHDFTENKVREDALQRMEETARQERDCFLAVTESSMDAIYLCSAVRDADDEIVDFIFTFLNANVEKMVSVPRKILLGGSMCELLPANRVLGLFEEYRRVVVTGKPYVTTFPIHERTVWSEWIRLRAVRLGDGVAITASDISAQKRAEERVHELERQDPVTQLQTRDAAIAHLVETSGQLNGDAPVLMVCSIAVSDLGHWNAQLGESGGDSLLKAVANRLARFTKSASVFRMGGAKFLFVAQARDERSAHDLAESLQRCLHQPFELQGLRITPGLRTEVHLRRDAVSSVEELLQSLEQTLPQTGPKLAQRAEPPQPAISMLSA